jgi:hypothetical protein
VDAAASYPQFAAAMPDYVMPNQFLPTDGGTINYAGVDSVSLRAACRGRIASRCTRRCRAASSTPTLARNFAGGVDDAADARGHRRRVLQPVAAPLLHQQPAARHRRAGLGQDRRLGPHGPRVLLYSPTGAGLNPSAGSTSRRSTATRTSSPPTRRSARASRT